MTTVFLARHASHDEVGVVLSGRSDIGLNAAGRAEAERLADRFADVPLTAIGASPRRRAQETAAIVAARHDLPVITTPGLDEIDFGRWTGQRFDTLDRDLDWQAWNGDRGRAATPAGETMAAVVTRADAIVATGDGPRLLVSHSDLIRGLVARYSGLDDGNVFGFDVAPGSLTTLAIDDGGVRVVAVGERPL